MASLQCPDCSSCVSPIAATAVIRNGRVLLLCAECFEGRSQASGQPSAEKPTPPAVPAEENTEAQETDVSLEPTAATAAVSLICDEAPIERLRVRASSPRLDDITGEMALESCDADTADTADTAQRWHQSLRRNWRQGHSVVLAIAFLAIASTFAFTRQTPILSSPELISASSTERGSPRLVGLDFEPSESALVHDLSVAFSESHANLPWVHPLAIVRQLPNKDDRRFGATRPGDRPTECLAGHCGVDLGGTRGSSVHAALGGRLVRVKREAGGRSGKYVAIEHPQGMRSYYMHMDRIHPDLIEGMEVASAEPIGTLGSTGVFNSPPHLHFSVQARREAGGWHYVDPEPMLEQATVLLADGRIPDRAPLVAAGSQNLANSWLAIGKNRKTSGSSGIRRSGKKGLSDEELGIVIDRGEISFSDDDGDGDGDGDVVVDTGDLLDDVDDVDDVDDDDDDDDDDDEPVIKPETSDTLIDAPRRDSKREALKSGEVSVRRGTPVGDRGDRSNSGSKSSEN